MDYIECLRWLLTLPDFERTGKFASRPDLAPMEALLGELGDPHLGRPTVHIAGSKGKGGTGVMIEGVLRAAGVVTGCYISPHLHHYNERIRMDGAPIDRDGFASAMTAVREAIGRVAPRFPSRTLLAFDALTAAGFVAFRDAGIDVQIVEVGLGGALDSTNVFHGGRHTAHSTQQRAVPHVVVLTPISLEHTAILGSTIGEIAAQKSGIITRGCAAVVAPQRESALDVFRTAARKRDGTIVEVAASCQLTRTSASAEGQAFRMKTARATYAASLPLAGRHQLENAATAIVACEELAERASIEITPEHVRKGLAGVQWPGRLEVLRRKPYVIVDGAHNGDSAKRMAAALREHFGLARASFLFGTLAGKDVASMAAAVAPVADAVFLTAWPSKRAADPRELVAEFRPHDVPVTAFGDLPQAFEAAVAHAGERGAVVAFGSIAFVASVREYVLGIQSDAMLMALE